MNFKIQDGKIVTILALENRCIKDVPSILLRIALSYLFITLSLPRFKRNSPKGLLSISLLASYENFMLYPNNFL